MKLRDRIYEDYIKRSRLPKYESILKCAKENGYRMMGILDYYNYIRENGDNRKEDRILLNRHDIDTSAKVAKRFFQIEKSIYGDSGSATYYFRKSTIDTYLIKEIESYGYETGYHYEEIADFEKKNKLKNLTLIQKHLPEIQESFINNLDEFRKITGSKSATVASHGDFINVLYNYGNLYLVKDESIRIRSAICLEAYDKAINDSIDARFADQKLLDDFSSEVCNALYAGIPHIQILTHPRNWKVDVLSNTKDNVKRLFQGLAYKL